MMNTKKHITTLLIDFNSQMEKELTSQNVQTPYKHVQSGSNWKKSPSSFSPNRNIRERVSLGIACVRFNLKKPEMLMIKKRYTYAFSVFAHGKFNANDNSETLKLLNEMTIEEKHDLLSLNYPQIWYRIWLDNTVRSASYFNAKNKFESAFTGDGGIRLRKLINKSTHGSCVWEIPKGRKKNKLESDVQCAMREFYEETRVSKNSYNLWLGAKRTYTYIDDGTKYINHYFIAYTRHNIEPRIEFGSLEQVEEVADIKWMDIEEIRRMDPTGKLAYFVKPIFNYVKKHTR